MPKDEDKSIHPAVKMSISPEGAQLEVGDHAIDKGGTVLGVLFSRRVAKARLEQGLSTTIAAKLQNGQPLEPHEAAYFALVFEKDFRRLQNQQSIIEQAQKLLPSIADSAPYLTEHNKIKGKRETSQDWLDRFLADAEVVSDEEVQELYARVLAGEYARPGSYSKRTLGVLRDLDREAAKLFNKIRNFCLLKGIPSSNGSPFEEFYKSVGITYDDLLLLDASGLLYLQEGVRQELTPCASGIFMDYKKEGDNIFRAHYGDRYIVAKYGSDVHELLISGFYPLTQAGVELCNIAAFEFNAEFFNLLPQWFPRIGRIDIAWAPATLGTEVTASDLQPF